MRPGFQFRAAALPTLGVCLALLSSGCGGRTTSTVPAKPAQPSVTLTAAQDTITTGSPTTLTWTSANANTVSLDNGIGDVAPNGSLQVKPATSTIFHATASGSGGVAVASAAVTVVGLPTIQFSANPQTVASGEPSTLTWSTANATSVFIEGLGTFAPADSAKVKPLITKTYNAVATGPTAATATASVTVKVATPDGTSSPISRLIVVIMQNNSFDHLFGMFPAPPGATIDGIRPGVPGYSQLNSAGVTVTPFLLSNPDPAPLPEGHNPYVAVLDGGAMDKFAFYNGDVAMGYYDETIPGIHTLWNYARELALADRYFGSVIGEAPTNQLYLVAASDNGQWFEVQPFFGPCQLPDVGAQPYTFPNVADQLAAKGISWASFDEGYGDCTVYNPVHEAFQYFVSTHDSKNLQDFSGFATQVQNGTLPAVSFVIPRAAHDMHPGNGPISNGINFLDGLIQTVQSSPIWNNAAIIITFDTGGGWYDHVPPPAADDQGLNFRVPTLLISPWAKKGYISHVVMDHVSILTFIQWNWGLPSLNQRNTAAGDLRDMFSF